MMRKLLILTLVLGMASMANAAFTLMVSDSGDMGTYVDPPEASSYFVNESDYIWIGVHNDTQGAPGATQKGQFYLALESGPNAQWTGNFQMYKQASGGPLVDGAPDNYYYGPSINIYVTGVPLVDLWRLTLTDGAPDTFNNIGVLDAKELHSSLKDSTETIWLLDQAMTILDTVTIHQIPEPMTMVLLGLGGLLLRRRK
jgi:hypothetical protein